MKPAEIITEELWKEFGDRKSKGRIDFVVDVLTDNIYPVPRNMEHSQFIIKLPDYSPKTTRYVPIQFRLEEGTIKEILVGASSYEARFGVFHTLEELQEANRCAWVFAVRSNIPLELKREKVFKNYAKKPV